MKPKFISALALALSLATASIADPTRYFLRPANLSVNAIVSGNGFGMHYNASYNFYLNRHLSLGAGAVFNAKAWHYSGLSVTGKYFLMQQNESFSEHAKLYFSFGVTRIMHDRLSRHSLQNERLASDALHNGDVDFCSLRYNGWQYSAGFGTMYCFGCGLVLQTGIGLAYHSTQQTGNHTVMTYHDDRALSLRISTGIAWNFDRQSTRKLPEMY